MELLSRLGESLADHRASANLIAAHGLITVIVLAAVLLRHLVAQGSSQLARWTRIRWLEVIGEVAARRIRALILWLSVATVLLTIAASVAYHFAGRDVREDLAQWYGRLTLTELFDFGLRCAAGVAVLMLSWTALRMVRRGIPQLEIHTKTLLGKYANEKVLHSCFLLVQYYLVAAIRLTCIWLLFRIGHFGRVVNPIYEHLLQMLTILVVARLAALHSRVLSRSLADLGDRQLAGGSFRRYWERMPPLFAFGERCFEAAIYVAALWLCARGFARTQEFANFYGPKVMRCIGIFFATRVLIELLQVLLGEIFGLYAEEESVDQKKRTLAPLLYSISQYVLYFGSVLVMLQELGENIMPILAGAGILGLAVGLGAQSLVTDVVSGFFILFENQYLVGDYVQIGDASGIVEAVGIRVTHIRDGQGKLYIIPNGQIKGVVSYSKGYVNAVVDLRVPSGSDLESTFRAMAEAGRRLRQAHREVLADTHIHGLIDFTTTDMTVRAVTKVRPGAHAAMQNEYRRLLKQVLDQNAAGAVRPAAAA
jgi:small-conductance mechanosensitive channel